MIRRVLTDTLLKNLYKGKAIVVTGPRQVGKTTLLEDIISRAENPLFLNADDPAVIRMLTSPTTEDLRRLLGSHRLVFIDEAQLVPGIGRTLKIITDRFKQVQLLVSGSSSFDLGSATQEPLTGRKREYHLYPVSWEEWEKHKGFLVAEQQLEQRLVYGFYPDVLNHPGEERDALAELVNSYLYRDVLALGGLRKPEILQQLLQALALQVGHEVSYNELSSLLQISKDTVSNYIDLLEKGFVVFRLHAYSRNLRNEIRMNRKIYFYDNGIRNALIGNYNPVSLRNDTGALWENFLVSERKKYLEYHRITAQPYFWRTKHGQEVDYVEERNGNVYGYEFKWNALKKVRFPGQFVETYNATTAVVNRENFRDFLM